MLRMNRENNELGLNEFVNNDENVIATTTNHQTQILETLRERYNMDDEESRIRTRRELASFIQTKYQANPAYNDLNRPLPLEWRYDEPDQRLTHSIHTAYRYLFGTPNPWISPGARYVRRNRDGSAEAYILRSDSRTILSIWSLLNDESAELLPGYSIEDLRETFIETISLMGRAHNFDNRESDDGLGDKPTCAAGVRQRLFNCLVGFALVEDPTQRNLNCELIAQKFKEEYITHDSKGLKPIIEGMSNQELKTLKEAVDGVILMVTPIDQLEPEQRAVMSRLVIGQDEQNEFFNTCNSFWTSDRITEYKEFYYQSTRFNTVQEFIQHMAANYCECFGQFLLDYVNRKVGELDEAQQPGAEVLAEEDRQERPEIAEPEVGDTDDIFAQIDMTEQLVIQLMIEEQYRLQLEQAQEREQARREAEQARQQEQARLEEQARQARVRAEAMRREQARREAEQVRRQEEVRQAEERARLARVREEAARQEQERREAEQARRQEEARQAEEQAILEIILREERVRLARVRQPRQRVTNQQTPQMKNAGNGVRRFGGLLI